MIKLLTLVPLQTVLCFLAALALAVWFALGFLEKFAAAVGAKGKRVTRALQAAHYLSLAGAVVGLVVYFDLPAIDRAGNVAEWTTIEVFGLTALFACGYIDGWWTRIAARFKP